MIQYILKVHSQIIPEKTLGGGVDKADKILQDIFWVKL